MIIVSRDIIPNVTNMFWVAYGFLIDRTLNFFQASKVTYSAILF